MEKTHYIGIDVSHLTLDICMLQGGQEKSTTIDNSVESIKKWISGLPQMSYCVFEATGVYSHKLEYLLHQQGILYSKVNPVRIKGFVHAQGWLNKSDQHDARYILRFAQTLKIEPTRGSKEDQIKKDRYVHSLAKLKKDLHNIENQIHVIKQEPVDMNILLNTYEHIKNVIEEQITLIEAALDELRSPSETDEIRLIQTIPGIGAKSAKAMLNAIGSFTYFDNDKQLVKYLGVAPVNATSGTSVRQTFGICHTAVPKVRSSLYMAVTAAVKSNPACGSLYLRLRQRGKPKKVVRIAVVNKLIRQAFAVVKSGNPYDPKHEEKTLK